MPMPPATLDPETLYRLIYERHWAAVLDLAHRHPAAVRDDPLLARALETFVSAFFADLAAAPEHVPTPALERLLLLHTGGFLPLPDDLLDTLVAALVRRHAANPLRALDFARFRPEHPECAAFLRSHAPPEADPVAHPHDDALPLTRTRPLDAVDATRSLFRSRQEVDFFLAVREVFASYVVYPNVALHSVLDYDRLRDRLTGPERRYFFHALLDCVVFDQHDGYRPRYFFELDSPLHDPPERREKDRLKERILALAGQRLYRLRPRDAAPDRAALVTLLQALLR